MGIRFNANSWRSPLLIIESLLPVGPVTPRPSRWVAPALQRFLRAGWIGRYPPSMPTSKRPRTPSACSPATIATLGCGVRVVRIAAVKSEERIDARLFISGRIGDVCAELERLAAQESQSTSRHITA